MTPDVAPTAIDVEPVADVTPPAAAPIQEAVDPDATTKAKATETRARAPSKAETAMDLWRANQHLEAEDTAQYIRMSGYDATDVVVDGNRVTILRDGVRIGWLVHGSLYSYWVIQPDGCKADNHYANRKWAVDTFLTWVANRLAFDKSALTPEFVLTEGFLAASPSGAPLPWARVVTANFVKDVWRTDYVRADVEMADGERARLAVWPSGRLALGRRTFPRLGVGMGR